MFLLQEEQKTTAEPAADAPLKEIVAYNLKRLQHKYLGDDKQRPVNLKLMMNVCCFLGASFCINQFGDSFAV